MLGRVKWLDDCAQRHSAPIYCARAAVLSILRRNQYRVLISRARSADVRVNFEVNLPEPLQNRSVSFEEVDCYKVS
jgi:hypothetical protein